MHKNNVLVITHLEKAGVKVFFNQASTGRVSGITHFMGNFKATARKLAKQTAGQGRNTEKEKQKDQQAMGDIAKTLGIISENQKALSKNQH